LATLKRRRVITSSDCNSKAFTAVNFAKSNDKNNQFLVTISGTPDFSVIIWLWDKQRCVARHRYCQDEIEQIPLHASFDPADPTMLLVTGNNLYNFFKINETNLQTLRGSLMKKRQRQVLHGIHLPHLDQQEDYSVHPRRRDTAV